MHDTGFTMQDAGDRKGREMKMVEFKGWMIRMVG